MTGPLVLHLYPVDRPMAQELVYALVLDDSGSVVASGTPARDDIMTLLFQHGYRAQYQDVIIHTVPLYRIR